MLNIHDLEKRWKIYKFKSFLPYFIIGITLLVVIPILYIFYTSKNSKTINIPIQEPIIEKKTIIKKEIAPQKSLQIQKTNQNKTIQTLQPSMNFMKNIQYEAFQIQLQKKQSPIKKTRKKIKSAIIQENIQNITPKINITIQRKETQNDIYEIIQRFKKNNNPALSLFVAKKYYELGKYEQSYNYALITNQINSKIEASWIIFTKSLVKLHKRNKAIHTLQEYIKVSHSSNAEILLNEIKSGKFR
ncbi:hypothetical protein [Sulfurimonas sp.]